MYAAGALEAFIGRKTDEIIGHPVEDIVAPAERGLLRELLAQARRRERMDNSAIRLTGPKGVTPPLRFAGYQLHDLNGHFFVALRHKQDGERQAGFGRRPRDEETGLLDGDSFVDMVTGHLASGDSDEERCMSLIVLPRFGDLRERLVEAAESELMTAIGASLNESSVDGDGAARLGDDRYGLVHSPDLDIEGLKGHIAGLTREADPLKQGVNVDSATIEMDAEAFGNEEAATGIVHALNQFRNSAATDQLLSNLSTSISKLAQDALGHVGQLREIISKQDFEINFHPILNIRSGGIRYYETLARIPARYGIKDIYEQVTFAEESGLITAFDLAMLQKVSRYIETKTARNGKSCFGVNVSGHSISALSYLAQVDRLIKNSPWLRERLVFEITESARISDIDTANGFIQRLRSQGFKVALDDFGAGAANFEYLSRLEVDLIKFDGSSINAAIQSKNGKAFVKALVAFARELGVATVTEMIEDEAALEFARACGVQFVQGFLFGEPHRDTQAVQELIPTHLFPDRVKVSGGSAGARR